MPKGAWLPRPRRIVVRYGEPWQKERVLADGGIEALRTCVAELARAPLREHRSKHTVSPTTASADDGVKAPPPATDGRTFRPPGL
jgi:hypothetical protein